MRITPALIVALFAFLIVASTSCNKRSGKPRILVFSKTAGFRHSSIPAGKSALIKMGQENDFLVDTTEDASYFTEDSLKNYSAVVFLNSTGDLLDHYQEAEFERYIQAGGGYVGIHAASDAEYDWGWYGRLVGAYFESHPHNQQAKLIVQDANHPSTKHLPKEWVRTDEWYNFKKLNPDVNVLLTIDEKSYEGGKNGDNHPMAWYHEYDGGRAFYTELGHTDESYSEENFLKHVLGGIQYAIGENNKLDYDKATTMKMPEEDRFQKTMLVQGSFFEPTEMTILPNLDILVAQRRGEVMLLKKGDSTVRQVALLNVYWKTTTPGVNAEEGLLGIQADPDFAKNNFVYLFYSPVDTSVNRLSRFVFKDDKLDLNSEKVILQFYSQREICCHTGGSIAFGPDRMLYLSTGDNSTPFDEAGQRFVNRGFAPIDDRPGHEQYDARRSAGNTNDLRGKILRIRINEDGSYDIPEGNLFAKDQASTRPEIYVMGNRNPYRISVDKKNGFLYWGEVGPDAANDSMATRGPRGYDEVNQARKAGFYGWPLFVGNNYAYREYDYNTGSTGTGFDPAKPTNNSRNNTGLQQLPPAQPAFIWYPYAESPDFPQVGTGGRNAMAGPVYYTDMFPKESRLPDYFNNKLFVYDWIRGWIKVVTMQQNGDFDKMEPFMKNTKYNAPIDMEVGPDGKLYILEYGNGWFSKNPDAGLSRIDYNAGNRPPTVENLAVDRTSGALPFTVSASVEAKDPERKPLKYRWNFGDGAARETTEPRISHTFEKAGDYAISVEVVDEDNATVKSNAVQVYAGNEAPQVTINVTGNKSFYFPGQRVSYSVSVEDKDDTSAMDPSSLVVSADYLEGSDRAASSQGHQVLTAAATGKNIMMSLDCKACHQEAKASVGPSYVDVAAKYKDRTDATSYLSGKIIRGSSGVWGETAMPAHPTLPENDARLISTYIMSLNKSANQEASLPPSGSVQPSLGKPVRENGVLYLSATYTDKGGNNIKPLTGNNTVSLRHPKINLRRIRTMQGFTSFNFEGSRVLVAPNNEGWIRLDSLDLTGVKRLSIAAGWQKAPDKGYDLDIRLDSPTGTSIGTANLAPTNSDKAGQARLNISLQPVTDGKMHNLFIVSKAKSGETNAFAITEIEFSNR